MTEEKLYLSLMKFAVSSKPRWMASSMWDRIRIQNYLDALKESGREGRGRKKERGKGKALHLKKRKKINKDKMETDWLAIVIVGQDVELALNQKLAAGLSALKFCHRRGKLLTGIY